MQDNSNTTKSRIEIAPQFVYSQPQQMMSTNIDTGRMLKLDGYENLIKVNLLDIIEGSSILLLPLFFCFLIISNNYFSTHIAFSSVSSYTSHNTDFVNSVFCE